MTYSSLGKNNTNRQLQFHHLYTRQDAALEPVQNWVFRILFLAVFCYAVIILQRLRGAWERVLAISLQLASVRNSWTRILNFLPLTVLKRRNLSLLTVTELFRMFNFYYIKRFSPG